MAEVPDERQRAVLIIEALAGGYEKTAKETVSDEVAFVAKEIADALRRCAAAVKFDAKPPAVSPGDSLSRAFIDQRPTKVDFSDKIVDA